MNCPIDREKGVSMSSQDIGIVIEDLDTLVEIARNNMTIGGWLGITESALLIKQLLEKQLNNEWILNKSEVENVIAIRGDKYCTFIDGYKITVEKYTEN